MSRGNSTMDKFDYRIPKIEMTAEIAIDTGVVFEHAEYTLFLDKFSRYRKGEETIYEFLNKRNEFIPLKKFSTGEFVIVNMKDIAYVKEREPFPAQYQRRIKLIMEHNFQLEVGHINPLPDSHSRVLDYLNQDTPFLLFYHEDQKIFINKYKIIQVKEQ
jgi:hypothetical protein